MYMMRILILAMVLFLALNGYSQQTEIYFGLSDSLIRKELSTFTRAARLPASAVNNKALKQIKLSRCGLDFVTFESGDWIALDKLVSISSSETEPCKVAEVRYLHYKYQIILPDSAIAGIINPRFCSNAKANHKIGKATSSDCRVFQSPDKKRVYIYMLNGAGLGQYEVTWVINENKYYGRIIDKVPATD
jgi:hypothetical protein